MARQKKRACSPTVVAQIKEFAKQRGKEFRALAEVELTAHSAHVNVAGQSVEFKINVERRAAWQLYVELNTRITTHALEESEGVLREALSSLHTVFRITREILKEAGPEVAQGPESLGFYAMEVLNQVLRPVLAEWHPALTHWEEQREPDVSAVEHEKNWERSKTLRRELESTRNNLLEYCDALAMLAGVSSEMKTGDRNGKTKGVRQLLP